MTQNTAPVKKTDPNIAPMEKMIEQMEFELSQASFGGDRQRVPLLLKQLKEARRILAKMTGDIDL